MDTYLKKVRHTSSLTIQQTAWNSVLDKADIVSFSQDILNSYENRIFITVFLFTRLCHKKLSWGWWI